MVKDKVTGETLKEGKDYELSYSDDVTNAGTVTVTITGKGNYAGKVETSYEITKRNITLTSASAEKVYDGSPLVKNQQSDVTVEGLAPADKVTFNITGSQTYVGTSKNTFTYEFSKDPNPVRRAINTVKNYFTAYAAGETKKIEDNYNVSVVYGDLTVTGTGVDNGTYFFT